MNNESDDGGGSDGRPLWFNQQAARGSAWRTQLEMCTGIPGDTLLNFYAGADADHDEF